MSRNDARYNRIWDMLRVHLERKLKVYSQRELGHV